MGISKMKYDQSVYQKFYMEQEYTFGQKGENKQSEPKNGIWAKKSKFSMAV
jgi:hypothetical protein